MSHRVRSITAVLTVKFVMLFTFLSVAAAVPRTAETKTVNMKDFKFDPQTISVTVGDSITWKNSDQAQHTATSDDGSFDTGDVQAGQEKTITFSKAGTFAYYCKYHGGPGGKGMAGTITVLAAAAQTDMPAAQAPTGAEVTGSLDVSDQPVVNGEITIPKATVSQDGWVVVHKAGPDGKLLLTPVIGQTQIKAGDTANVIIKLTEPVAVGAPLWPMIHVDLGEKGKYEFPNGPDVPAAGDKATVQIKVLEASGGTAMPAAQAPTGAEVTGSLDVSDQPVVNGEITIPKATVSQDGWVVVHKAGPDGKLLLTPVIGQTQIKAGDTANVVIKLTEPVAVGAPLWPMIHVDLGEKGKYEFPNGPDVPAAGDKATVQIKVLGAGSSSPRQLPRTGGENAMTMLLMLAFIACTGGTLLLLRSRQPRV